MNPLINAIVEDRFEAAIREARDIDNFLKSTTMDEAKIASEKPLLGLPVTIKESIAVQGKSHTSILSDVIRIHVSAHINFNDFIYVILLLRHTQNCLITTPESSMIFSSWHLTFIVETINLRIYVNHACEFSDLLYKLDVIRSKELSTSSPLMMKI